MRISDWSSDVCSSDLDDSRHRQPVRGRQALQPACLLGLEVDVAPRPPHSNIRSRTSSPGSQRATSAGAGSESDSTDSGAAITCPPQSSRSEEHTSELQSLMRISYAVFCLKKKTTETKIKVNTRVTRT